MFKYEIVKDGDKFSPRKFYKYIGPERIALPNLKLSNNILGHLVNNWNGSASRPLYLNDVSNLIIHGLHKSFDKNTFKDLKLLAVYQHSGVFTSEVAMHLMKLFPSFHSFGLFEGDNTTAPIVVISPLKSRYFKIRIEKNIRTKRGHVVTASGRVIPIRSAVRLKDDKWYEKEHEAIKLYSGNWVKRTADTIKDAITGDYINLQHPGNLKLITSFTAKNVATFGYNPAKPEFGYSRHIKQVQAMPVFLIDIDKPPLPILLTDELKDKCAYNPTADAYFPKQWLEDSSIVKHINSNAHYVPFNFIKNKILINPKYKYPVKILSNIKKHNRIFGVESITDSLTENKGYTFGVEIETSNGLVRPHRVLNKLNLKCVRDGSVSGGEYVTGVLTGDSGFNQLKKVCALLTERCVTNKSCGVHVHIGNASFTKEFSIYLYILSEMLQHEIFTIQPHSRLGNTYCRELNISAWLTERDIKNLLLYRYDKESYDDAISTIYDKFYKYLSLGKSLGKNMNKAMPHPGGHYAGGHGSPRYEWLNFINANFLQHSKLSEDPFEQMPFGMVSDICDKDEFQKHIVDNNVPNPKGDKIKVASDIIRDDGFKRLKENLNKHFTIEFRVHAATTKYYKIRNWILICMGIVSYAENNVTALLDALEKGNTINLTDVLTSVYSQKLANKLLLYIDKRKTYFMGSSASEDNFIVNDSIKYDESLLTTVKEIKE